MNAFDPELLRALADADAQSPPPGGTAITPHALLAAEAQRTRRQLLGVAALSLATLAFVLAWPRGRAPGARDDDDGVQAQLRALRVDLQCLQARLAELSPLARADGSHDHSAARLRYELANARAGAVLATTASKKENR